MYFLIAMKNKANDMPRKCLMKFLKGNLAFCLSFSTLALANVDEVTY